MLVEKHTQYISYLQNKDDFIEAAGLKKEDPGLSEKIQKKIQNFLTNNDRFSFLRPSEWRDLYQSPGLALSHFEIYSKPRIITGSNRYTIEITEVSDCTEEKINNLIKDLNLPNDVTCKVINYLEDGAVLEFSSRAPERHLSQLSYAKNYNILESCEYNGYTTRDPRFGVKFK